MLGTSGRESEYKKGRKQTNNSNKKPERTFSRKERANPQKAQRKSLVTQTLDTASALLAPGKGYGQRRGGASKN